MQWRTQDFIMGRTEAPKAGVVYWGRGSQPAAKRFWLYLNAPDSFSCNCIWVDTLLIFVTKVPAKHTECYNVHGVI